MDSQRERDLQAFVEGRIDRDELRRRAGREDGEDALAREVTAYRLVYEALLEEPRFSLPPDFAERVAQAAMPSAGRHRSWAGVVVTAALLGAATGVAVAVGFMAVQLGSPPEASPAVSALRTMWESLRPDLIGAVLGSLGVLGMADRMASRMRGGGRRSPAGT